MFYFYIVRCADGTLYCGCTTHVEKRINRHNSGKGSLWVKQHGNATIVHVEPYGTLTDARRRELQVKKWSRIKKEGLIKGLKP